MKRFFMLAAALYLAACNAMIPYKDQSLDYLHGIEQSPANYRGKVVSFGGEVKGVTEDTRRLRLVLKINVPLYYYATGKDPLSYELLLVSFNKQGIAHMTGIKKGSNVKILARVDHYETSKNLLGKDVAVLHLQAFALADRSRDVDFFRPETPDLQLYESWKAGRLFFEEQPQEVQARFPTPKTEPVQQAKQDNPPAAKSVLQPEPDKIIFDEEEAPFILPSDEPPLQDALGATEQQDIPSELPPQDTPNATDQQDLSAAWDAPGAIPTAETPAIPEPQNTRDAQQPPAHRA